MYLEKCIWPSTSTAPIAMSDSRRCTTTALTVVWLFPLAFCMRWPRAWRYASTVARPHCRCDTAALVSRTLLVRALSREDSHHSLQHITVHYALAGARLCPSSAVLGQLLQRTDREGCGAPHLWHSRRGSLAVSLGEKCLRSSSGCMP
jgi:hypothetical protein